MDEIITITQRTVYLKSIRASITFISLRISQWIYLPLIQKLLYCFYLIPYPIHSHPNNYFSSTESIQVSVYVCMYVCVCVWVGGIAVS